MKGFYRSKVKIRYIHIIEFAITKLNKIDYCFVEGRITEICDTYNPIICMKLNKVLKGNHFTK